MTTFYVTTPIYYINDVPHLGSAYTTIAADVLARYHKLRGHDAFFLTGTDEHGLKIQRAAEERRIAPQQLADEISPKFAQAWRKLGCAPDSFIRTSSQAHKRAVQGLWTRIKDKGDIYLGHYEGLYCVSCEGYYTEKELDQPGNLCRIHKKPAEIVKEESYFFKLKNYQERLLEYYEKERPVEPEGRLNEVKSFVAAGLEDLSISRTTFKWGVPVPGDDRHVMYVWFDALSNYWTALQQKEEWKKYWPADVHVMGKDILRFHAVYWPAFLMAAGEKPPKKVVAHGFLSYGGQKMSKSLRNTISPVALAEAISPEVGVDVVRYCLMRAIAFGRDGDFSIDDVLSRYEAELGNALGNLLNRVLPFANEVPPTPRNYASAGKPFAAAFDTAATQVAKAFDYCDPTAALRSLWELLGTANNYVNAATPWVHWKEKNNDALDPILHTLLETLEAVSVMIWPVMPIVSREIRAQLGLAELRPQMGVDLWPFEPPSQAPGRTLPGGKPIFPRHDPKVAEQIRKQFAPPKEEPPPKEESPAAPELENKEPEKKSEISYDDFAKLELRVGVIAAAEKIPKKDRLLALKVDVGEAAPRAIIAGIASAYAPEQLVGKRVAVLVNLAPKSFGKGLVSHGMLLAASTKTSSTNTEPAEVLRLVAVPDELPAGAVIK